MTIEPEAAKSVVRPRRNAAQPDRNVPTLLVVPDLRPANEEGSRSTSTSNTTIETDSDPLSRMLGSCDVTTAPDVASAPQVQLDEPIFEDDTAKKEQVRSFVWPASGISPQLKQRIVTVAAVAATIVFCTIIAQAMKSPANSGSLPEPIQHPMALQSGADESSPNADTDPESDPALQLTEIEPRVSVAQVPTESPSFVQTAPSSVAESDAQRDLIDRPAQRPSPAEWGAPSDSTSNFGAQPMGGQHAQARRHAGPPVLQHEQPSHGPYQSALVNPAVPNNGAGIPRTAFTGSPAATPETWAQHQAQTTPGQSPGATYGRPVTAHGIYGEAQLPNYPNTGHRSQLHQIQRISGAVQRQSRTPDRAQAASGPQAGLPTSAPYRYGGGSPSNTGVYQ